MPHGNIAAWEGNRMTLSITDGESLGQDQRRRVSAKRAQGSIAVYRGKARTVGIDAIVPAPLGWKMLLEIMPDGSLLYACQVNKGGMIAIDAQVTASLAAKVLAEAEQAGVSVRR